MKNENINILLLVNMLISRLEKTEVALR